MHCAKNNMAHNMAKATFRRVKLHLDRVFFLFVREARNHINVGRQFQRRIVVTVHKKQTMAQPPVHEINLKMPLGSRVRFDKYPITSESRLVVACGPTDETAKGTYLTADKNYVVARMNPGTFIGIGVGQFGAKKIDIVCKAKK